MTEEQKQRKADLIRAKKAADPEKYKALQRIAQAKYYEKNTAARRENTRQWALANPAKSKAHYNDARKDKMLRALYGIGLEDKKIMLDNQGGLCAICNKALKIGDSTTHVDHNHTTGLVRGVLCNHCNRLLGACFDNAEVLKSAIKYLDNNNV